MSSESIKNVRPFVRSYCEELLTKYNQYNSTIYKLIHYIVQDDDLDSFATGYLNLIFECLSEDDPQWYQIDKEYIQSNVQVHEQSINTINNGVIASEMSIEYPISNVIEMFFIIKVAKTNKDDDDEHYKAFQRDYNITSSLLNKFFDYAEEPFCPKCYLILNDYIALEDLRKSGYHLVNLQRSEPLSEIELLPLLKSLATLHACSLIYEYTNNININDIDGCLTISFVNDENIWFKRGIAVLYELAKIHPKYQEQYEQQFIEKNFISILESIYKMVLPSKNYPNVLCYRNQQEGNIFLHQFNHQAPAIFIDFQYCFYAPPIIDLIFTFYTNLHKENQISKDDYYLKFYYEKLCKCLTYNTLCEESVNLNKEKFLKSYDEFRLLGLVYRSLNILWSQIPKNFNEYTAKDKNWLQQMLHFVYKTNDFNNELFDCIEDIIVMHIQKSCN